MFQWRVQSQFHWRNAGRFLGNIVSPSLSRSPGLWSRRSRWNTASTRAITTTITDMATTIITVEAMDMTIITVEAMDMTTIMVEAMDIIAVLTMKLLSSQFPMTLIAALWENWWKIFRTSPVQKLLHILNQIKDISPLFHQHLSTLTTHDTPHLMTNMRLLPGTGPLLFQPMRNMTKYPLMGLVDFHLRRNIHQHRLVWIFIRS